MGWKISQDKTSIIDIIDEETSELGFEIPVLKFNHKIGDGEIICPRFFKPHFLLYDSGEGYNLILRNSSGLKRLFSHKESPANPQDYMAVAVYSMGSLPAISDNLSDSVSFAEWDDFSLLEKASSEIRSIFDNLQQDIISGFYRSFIKHSFIRLKPDDYRDVLNIMAPMGKEAHIID